jgi:predicted RNase H-like nuclease (RuvC/YqgF family)
MEKIQQILLDLSGEAAFSGEAMKQFLELKGEVDSQEGTIRFLRSEREKGKDKIGDLNSKITTLEAVLGEKHHEIEGWHTRESELQDREGQITKLEMTAAYEEKRREDHQEMVGLIFRNTELRTKVLGQELSLVPGDVEIRDQYGNIVQSQSGAYYIGTPVEKTTTESKE